MRRDAVRSSVTNAGTAWRPAPDGAAARRGAPADLREPVAGIVAAAIVPFLSPIEPRLDALL